MDSRDICCYGETVSSTSDSRCRLRISALALMFALLINALTARAMVVLKRDFPDLVARSEQIVIARSLGYAKSRTRPARHTRW